jgi:hypothetical protein
LGLTWEPRHYLQGPCEARKYPTNFSGWSNHFSETWASDSLSRYLV